VTGDEQGLAVDVRPPNPTDEAFWDIADSAVARQRLVDALKYELLGPAEDEEELFESPVTRYLTGLLAPFGTGVLPSEQDVSLAAHDGDDDVGVAEAAPPISQAMTPSSIGISFLIPENVTGVAVRASWGEYHRLRPSEVEGDGAPEEEEEVPAGFEEEQQPPEEGSEPGDGGRPPRRPRWKRHPQNQEPIRLVLKPGDGLQRHPIGDSDVTLEHLARRIAGHLAVSIFLVNRRHEPEKGLAPADRWIYQPSLTISAEGGQPIFQPRELEPSLGEPDRDLQSNRLLYRNKREHAVGHGCAAEWDLDDGAEAARELRTSLVPRFELPRIEPRALGGEGLEMSVLANCSDGDQLRSLLEPLVSGYANWIDNDKAPQIETLPRELRAVATQHLDDCRLALKRIERAIAQLADDPDAFEAFRFANRAMLLQRSHTEWASVRRKMPEAVPETPVVEGRWRPFQLAFILLNLPGLIDPKDEDRRVGDLLWFPTGGGKTEAYLGLTAFTIALRRLRKTPGFRTDAGVSVLMRYTLRLLTIQQFQRAVALICGCEVIRREAPERWGHRRFSTGLWVGISATPTTHAESRRALARLKAGDRQPDKNPCQLESCPWCGETLTYNDYLDDGDALRTYVYCPRPACEFSRSSKTGLPVLMVDEEIYRECPSMVISTVDKFAQMPWNGQIQALFGRVESECGRCGFLTPDSDHQQAHGPEDVHATERLAPLELIIQDELHLISGPLGTLVGLYETAVEWLSTRIEGGVAIVPKVVASTATVRRAFEQVHALFDRTLRVFPPPGLEPEDSFFAIEEPVTEVGGRMYVGVMGPGKSMKTAVVRVASILLAVGSGLAKHDADAADAYMTLVMYFNSLRELGGAVRLMDDDVVSRLEQLRERGVPRRFPPRYEELTSRISSERIPRLLRQLEQPHNVPAGDAAPPSLDAVLASNMISVGVDVQRLGLMTVMGQPKTTAEYIQATSRVGRQASAPGLVVTLYNWARPRDLSHYERFGQYHATFYRNVEAVSATPFSSRARDRGLAGAFVAMARLAEFDLDHEEAADGFSGGDGSIVLAIEQFRRRAESVANAATAGDLERQLAALVSEWEALAEEPLRYGWRAPDPANVPKSAVLLRQAEGGRWGHWDAPGSLREVEENSPVYLLGLDGA
jgi:hypothetical protein